MATPVSRERLQALCEAIVPGSAAAGTAEYVERAAAALPPPQRAFVAGALERLGDGGDLEKHAATPEFGLVRALAIEAYYSDFVADGRPGPGAWEVIDFNSPLARRLDKDFGYLEET
jgi:hypothetical protein